MQSFIELLRDVIHEVDQTGGDPLEKLVPDPTLVQRLREYVIERLRGSPETAGGHFLHGFLFEEFHEGFFDEGIRAATIYLTRLGITEPSDVEVILYQVVDKRLDVEVFRNQKAREGETIGVEEAIVASTQEVWEEGGTERSQAYTFARRHLLISWDYCRNRWQATNLGKFFQEISPFQATCFLLTLDTVLSTGQTDFRHISRDQLEQLLQAEHPTHSRLIPLHRRTLHRMGLLQEQDWDKERDLTPVGKAVLERVLDPKNLLRDTAILLLQSEELGLAYSGFEVEIERLEEEASNSPLLDDANRESVQNALTLWRQGQFADGLRVLFPSIEAIINALLLSAGERSGIRTNLKGRIDTLQARGIIPDDVAGALQVVREVRNNIVHAQLRPSDRQEALPFCQMTAIYLRRLLTVSSMPRESDSGGPD